MSQPENALLRRRVMEVSAKIAEARLRADALRTDHQSPATDAALAMTEREIVVWQGILKPLVTQLADEQ